MVADVENQKTPLVSGMEMNKRQLKASDVNDRIERDDDEGLRQLVKKFEAEKVWNPERAPSALIETPLHLAARKGKLKCLQVLLESSPPPAVLDAPDQDGNTSLMEAVKAAQDEAVDLLLKAGAHVNARNDKGQSALHLITYAISTGSKPEDVLQKIANLLIARPDIDLEAHNDSGLTPLSAAAERLPQGDGAPRSGGLITFCSSLVKAGASLEEDGGSDVNEEVLRSKRALTAILMRAERGPQPTRPAPSQFLDMFVLRKSAQDIKDFMSRNSRDSRVGPNCLLGSKSLLFRAVARSDEDLVRILLKAGANAWYFENTKELAIYRAAVKGHVAIFDLLIEHMKSDKKKTVDLQEYTFDILEKVIENSRRRKGTPAEIDHSKCLERLMQSDVLLDFNKTFFQESILHKAAAFNNQDILCAMLTKGAFLGARRIVNGVDRGNVLNSLLPGTLEKAMDGCVTHLPKNSDEAEAEAENVLSEDYTLKLDYSFLVPPVNTEQKGEMPRLNEMETLMDISKSKRHRQAIKHPLVETLLYAKWRRALPLYLLNLGLYFFFVILLTAFVYNLKDLRILEARADQFNKSGEQVNATLVDDIETKQTAGCWLMAFLLPLTLYMLVRELFQVFFSCRTYWKNIENYLEWFLILVVIIMCAANLDVDVTRHLAAWAMIVAWYEFVLILGRAPPLAIYITMLRHVSWNFLKLIFLYGALLLAFTISFNIILQPAGTDESEFSDFWTTLPKAIVMATGEFEYSDLNEQFSRKMLFFASAIMVFLLFLFVIFLVLMNVMNGLAVTDTQLVMEDAKLYSLTSRLELVYLIESLFQLVLKCPGMKTPSLRLLTGPFNDPVLHAMVNEPLKGRRLLSGKSKTNFNKLDDNTANNLRMHRQQYLEEQERELRGDPVVECLSILKDLHVMAERHPQVLREAAISLRSGQIKQQ